ncbi:CHAT domain-containing protein [uncultured Aquimarina sp.]|uniref:CHAT domain-containing protein n=1 Tax=uncultured Aquimarina sp. TaxID=575652 RepID=UPI00260A6E15|nr:CHAT domain-containing protein [uncultured Aquimarina sp.]
MNLIKTIIVFVFFTSITFSQTKTTNDTILAYQYLTKADSLQVDRDLDSSTVYFNKALAIYKKSKTWERVMSCYNEIAENQWRNHELEKSFQNSQKALEISNTYLKKDSKMVANAYDNIAIYYEKTPNYEKSFVYYKKALDVRKKLLPENHSDIAISYSNLGLIHRKLGKFQKALEYHKKSLEINLKTLDPNHSNTGGSYNNIGMVYDDMGKLDKALEYYQKFLEVTINRSGKDHLYVGYSYINIGITYANLNQYDKAISYYLKAEPIFTNKNKLYELTFFYESMGVAYFEKGAYEKSLQYSKKGLDIAVKIYGEQHVNVASLYSNIGTIYSKKNELENGVEYHNTAIEIYKTAFGENHYLVAEGYQNIGNYHKKIKDYDTALEYYKKAIDIYSASLEKDNPKIVSVYKNIADLYYSNKKNDDALVYHQKGLEILQSSYGENHLLTADSYNLIAEVYQNQKEYNKAIVNYDKALDASSKKNYQNSTQDSYDPNNYYNWQLLLKSLKGKAKTLQLRYQQNNKELDLKRSILLYQDIDILVDRVRQSFQKYEDKVFFAKEAKEVYRDAIETQILFYQKTKDDLAIEKALYYTEKSKSNILKELLSDANAKGFMGLPEKTLELEKSLKSLRAFYRSKIAEEQSKTAIDSVKIEDYKNELFKIDRRQDSLSEVVESKYPKYHQLKYDNDVVSLDKIQQKLDDKTTLLEFFTADSFTYAFAISKNTIAVKELVTPKLTEQVEKLRATIIDKNIRAYKELAFQLHQQLIMSLKDQIAGDELIIVPDGPLWHLNFDLLLSQKDGSNNPKELSYLLKEYVISYANSATLLFSEDKNLIETSENQEECLAFSFSDSTNVLDSKTMSLATLRDTGDDLPGTRKEIKAIADIIDGNYFYGSEAVEANFKQHASQYNILHLALHGEVDNERPENSKLFFTKNKDTIEDNLLYSHELFALDIPAKLTVLSACNTGTGKIAKGEGIMSLGTAFQYAGTKSLLLSSWEVSDQTTPELMKYFYTNLKEGMSKAKALQQAKLQYLSNANLNRTQPFYWGGFYLVGDRTPIQFHNNDYIYWLIGFGVLALILLSLFWYRRRNSPLERG